VKSAKLYLKQKTNNIRAVETLCHLKRHCSIGAGRVMQERNVVITCFD
jgi:hypothetical protein